jgi:hypothetical protein
VDLPPNRHIARLMLWTVIASRTATGSLDRCRRHALVKCPEVGVSRHPSCKLANRSVVLKQARNIARPRKFNAHQSIFLAQER